MKALVLMTITILISGCSSTPKSTYIDKPPLGEKVLQKLARLKQVPELNTKISDGWTIIKTQDGKTVWSFTPPGHPAHPAFFKFKLARKYLIGSLGFDMACEGEYLACVKFAMKLAKANQKVALGMNRRI